MKTGDKITKEVHKVLIFRCLIALTTINGGALNTFNMNKLTIFEFAHNGAGFKTGLGFFNTH
jgi:hypothetical protein